MAYIDLFRKYKQSLEFYGNLYTSRKLTNDEESLLKNRFSKNTFLIRNVYDFDIEEETNMWYIIQDRYIPIDQMRSSHTKKQLRKSLKEYRYEKVSEETFRKIGYRIFLEDQQRRNQIITDWSEQDFIDNVNEWSKHGRDYWVGYSRETGEPAMWNVIYVGDGFAIKERLKLSIHYTKHNPTYGLNYTLCEYYLEQQKLQYISAGMRTMTEHSNIQNFLIDKMEFRKAYCRLQLEIFQPFKLLGGILYPFRKYLRRFHDLYAYLQIYGQTKEYK